MTDLKPVVQTLLSEPKEAIDKVNQHLLANTSKLEETLKQTIEIREKLEHSVQALETALEILS